MTKQKNPWKAATIIVLILVVCLGMNLYNPTYNFDGFKVDKLTLDKFSEAYNNEPFSLCQQDKCLAFYKLKS